MKKSVLAAITFSAVAWLATHAFAASFSFSTGNPDGLLGALSQPAEAGIETETADDFILTDTTVIKGATIVGLVPAGAQLSDVTNVEIEVYHVFPKDSDTNRTPNVPTRNNSPADVEIDSATRDGSLGTLNFSTSLLDANFKVTNTVVNKIVPKTGGEGGTSGEEVQIAITFNGPIVLPPDHYFFRPQALVTGGDFLFLSAPKPTAPPLFVGDLQAWIRNATLAPDWLRIGTDIIDGTPAPQFNMTFSLSGETVPGAGKPGQANCHGKSISALAAQFGGISSAASALGFSGVDQLQDSFTAFCE